MLHSALVDADWIDTDAHFTPANAARRTRPQPTMAELWTVTERAQQMRIERAEPTHLNRVRAEIYRACVDAAERPPGTFTLTVPTGGGKTLSGLAFALRHAVRWDKRRVIVALPYTSIIEQNADVYRDLLGDDAVLEHSSAARWRHERPGASADPDESEAYLRRELAAENWDAPVVVTTTVQLLESLFSNRNARLRKLHRVAGSVVVLDEAQTLPPHLLAPTLDVLGRLVRDYGVTLVLSTATPPALAAREGFDGLTDITPIVDNPGALAARLARVTYDVQTDEPWSWTRVADEMETADRALVIVNTKRDAAALLDELSARDPDPARAPLHLSTNQCAAHRRTILAHVRQRLDAGEPIRLVSTQVIEAGVDISFPLVLRALGPLDRIVQAAGRCNRSGELGPRGGRVVVFEPSEGSAPPGAYRRATDKTRTLLTDDPALDLNAPDTALRFFRLFYATENTDAENVQAMREGLNYAQTDRAYRLIEDEGVPVVVDYADGHAAARAIEAARFPGRDLFRAAQPFTVTLRRPALESALSDGLAREIADGLYLWTGRYDGGLGGRGLRLEGGAEPESLMW
jgi:CRISPR-associated endonuclease/helicase Cas3